MESPSTLQRLFEKTAQAARAVAKFIAIFALGIAWAVLVALPWALRAGAVAFWAWGVLAALQAVYRVYESAPGLAEYALLVLPVLGFVTGGYIAWKVSDERRWGVLFGTGGLLWFAAHILEWAWQTRPEAVALAPAVLYVAGSVYLFPRLRFLLRKAYSQISQIS